MNNTGGPWPVTVTVNGAACVAGVAAVGGGVGAGAAAVGDCGAGGCVQPAASARASIYLGVMLTGREAGPGVTRNRHGTLLLPFACAPRGNGSAPGRPGAACPPDRSPAAPAGEE